MASTGASTATAAAPEFGWRQLPIAGAAFDDWKRGGRPDEELVCASLGNFRVTAVPTGRRNQSHDLEVVKSSERTVVPGLYEVKRLSRTKSGGFDRRFKLGRRGESVYGRRDAEIKAFAVSLENFLDDCLWGIEATVSCHDFIDQALQRRHGKKFIERLNRLAKRGLEIPALAQSSHTVLRGGVFDSDIRAGFAGLSGIFIIAGPIYTLVSQSEYTRFIGFDSASAEGPKLAFLGVVPSDTDKTDKEKES